MIHSSRQRPNDLFIVQGSGLRANKQLLLFYYITYLHLIYVNPVTAIIDLYLTFCPAFTLSFDHLIDTHVFIPFSFPFLFIFSPQSNRQIVSR